MAHRSRHEVANTEPLGESPERLRHRRQFRLQRRLTRLDQELRRAHRRLRQSAIGFVATGSLANLLTTPLIYALVVPMVILDVSITLFQRVAFPIYGVTLVKRRPYFAIDRHKLAYLNVIEKLNCTYCSYANGLFAYAREVAGRTEQYWCPIRHARAVRDPHQRYPHFIEYGDAEGYHRRLPHFRARLARPARAR